MQSPIDLSVQTLSTNHTPSFSYTGKVAGQLSNWGYGPGFALNNTNGEDITGNPSFEDGGKKYYLKSWHTHTPSEHLTTTTPSLAELHLVHADSTGSVIGVLGLPISLSTTSSPFFAQLLSLALPSVGSTSHIELDELDMSLALKEGGGD